LSVSWSHPRGEPAEGSPPPTGQFHDSFERVRVESYGDHHIVVVEVCDGLYVSTLISCPGSTYYYEFIVGDENLVIALEKVPCLDRALEVVKGIYEFVVPR